MRMWMFILFAVLLLPVSPLLAQDEDEMGEEEVELTEAEMEQLREQRPAGHRR